MQVRRLAVRRSGLFTHTRQHHLYGTVRQQALLQLRVRAELILAATKWQYTYNHDRPHMALNMQTPTQNYVPIFQFINPLLCIEIKFWGITELKSNRPNSMGLMPALTPCVLDCGQALQLCGLSAALTHSLAAALRLCSHLR